MHLPSSLERNKSIRCRISLVYYLLIRRSICIIYNIYGWNWDLVWLASNLTWFKYIRNNLALLKIVFIGINIEIWEHSISLLFIRNQYSKNNAGIPCNNQRKWCNWIIRWFKYTEIESLLGWKVQLIYKFQSFYLNSVINALNYRY
jgi:hypothetical protein